MELITQRLTLREFRPGDFTSFWELESHPATYHYESACPDEAATRKYLNTAGKDARQNPRPRYRFALAIHHSDEVRGRVTLALLNASVREWEIGWALHSAWWGQGIAAEAAHRVLEFAFADLGAHRVTAFSHAGNLASLRVMEKLGMQREGLLRETRHWQGGWVDEVVYAILEREYRRPQI